MVLRIFLRRRNNHNFPKYFSIFISIFINSMYSYFLSKQNKTNSKSNISYLSSLLFVSYLVEWDCFYNEKNNLLLNLFEKCYELEWRPVLDFCLHRRVYPYKASDCKSYPTIPFSLLPLFMSFSELVLFLLSVFPQS